MKTGSGITISIQYSNSTKPNSCAEFYQLCTILFKGGIKNGQLVITKQLTLVELFFATQKDLNLEQHFKENINQNNL